MKKKLHNIIYFSFLFILGTSFSAYSQNFRIYGNIGAIYTITQTDAEYSYCQKAKVYAPLTSTAGIGIDKILNKRYFIGTGIAIEEFDFYHQIRKGAIYNKGNNYNFSRNYPHTLLILHEVFLRFGYSIMIDNKKSISFIITPKIGHFIYGGKQIDTSVTNQSQRQYSNTGGFEYFTYNVNLKTGLNFLLNASMEYEYKLGQKQRFSLAAAIAYQQGFRHFTTYTGYMAETGVSEGVYTTKVNGSGIQLNFGMKYNFGFNEKVRMLGKFK